MHHNTPNTSHSSTDEWASWSEGESSENLPIPETSYQHTEKEQALFNTNGLWVELTVPHWWNGELAGETIEFLLKGGEPVEVKHKATEQDKRLFFNLLAECKDQ